MKKTMLCLFTILMIAVICSCDQAPSATVKQTDSLSESIECLGSVNKIYESTTAKFVTGETLLNYKGTNVVFIGKLVEYNSLTKSFSDYVEKITQEENALMHQSYSVVYNADKKYVEFCAYVDKTTGIVQEYEIRVFNGDFVYKKGQWYAKSCYFNNTFTKDLSNNLDVNFGFTLPILVLNPETLPTSAYVYDCSTGKLVETPSDESGAQEVVTQEYSETLAEEVMAAIKKIGTVARIVDEGEKISFKIYGNMGYYTCIVEYSEVKKEYTKLFDDKYASSEGFNAMYRFNHPGFGGGKQTFNEGSSYIEVIGQVNSKTGKISSYELRRIDAEKYTECCKNNKWTLYATSIDVSSI